MKKLILVGILLALAAMPVLAVPTVTVDRVGAVYNPFVGGGEYRIVPNAELIAITAETGSFLSFCLEASEPIVDDGSVTYFAAVLTEAILGNGNADTPGPLGGDLLDPATAYLYTQFRKGTLVGYNSDFASAGALQQAIWYIEDELTVSLDTLSPQAVDWVNEAESQGLNDIGNVRVLHLWFEDDSGKPKLAQDMLVMVPAPGAILLGSIGVGLVGWLRRRRAL